MKKAIACLLVLLTVLSIVPISASATSATMTVKIGSAAVVFPDQKPVVKILSRKPSAVPSIISVQIRPRL